MTSMVERVARILDPNAFKVLDEGDKWRIVHFHGDRVAAKERAKEIIEALRDNTPEMCRAGIEAIDDYEDMTLNSPGKLPDARSVLCWQAMIDEALKEG